MTGKGAHPVLQQPRQRKWRPQQEAAANEGAAGDAEEQINEGLKALGDVE